MVDWEFVDIVQNRAWFVVDTPTCAKDFWFGIVISGYRFARTTRTGMEEDIAASA
jgi:hypothetical protein